MTVIYLGTGQIHLCNTGNVSRKDDIMQVLDIAFVSRSISCQGHLMFLGTCMVYNIQASLRLPQETLVGFILRIFSCELHFQIQESIGIQGEISCLLWKIPINYIPRGGRHKTAVWWTIFFGATMQTKCLPASDSPRGIPSFWQQYPDEFCWENMHAAQYRFFHTHWYGSSSNRRNPQIDLSLECFLLIHRTCENLLSVTLRVKRYEKHFGCQLKTFKEDLVVNHSSPQLRPHIFSKCWNGESKAQELCPDVVTYSASVSHKGPTVVVVVGWGCHDVINILDRWNTCSNSNIY